MNHTAIQNSTGSVDPFVAELQAITGTYPPSADQQKRNQFRKSELDFRLMKHRADVEERRRESLKEGARRNMRGEV